MVFSWILMLSSGVDVLSLVHPAILVKDAIYACIAVAGGILLAIRHPVGWWSAVIHWCWYLSCEVVVVATAEVLDWTIPVRHDPPVLYRVMLFTGALGATALAILLWTPIAQRSLENADRRKRFTIVSLSACVALAFLVNAWM